MERTTEGFERDIEQVFADAAMAEGTISASPADDLKEAAETFECSFVDVAFAEAGEFTETACRPQHSEHTFATIV